MQIKRSIMNKQRFFLIIFLLIYASNNCAMQEEKKCTKIIGNVTFPAPVSAIMCTTPGKVDILHSSHYTSSDYTIHESATSSSNVYATKSEIYFHPRANKIFLIAETKNACYAD